jgi:hypothetical protein
VDEWKREYGTIKNPSLRHCFPSILSLIILIPHSTYGNDIFKSENGFIAFRISLIVLFIIAYFIEIVFGIWSVVLCDCNIRSAETIYW